MGMSAHDLKTMLPDIRPVLGMFDGAQSDDSETVKDGMYTSRSNEPGYSEAMAYGIKGGRVTQLYWSSKKMASHADVKGFRKHLSTMHGEPKLGYKTKVTKGGIAKITTEVFSVKDTNLVISISSALGETEIAILDTNDPEIDLNELYFSFEKQRQRLQRDLLSLTKIAPNDEAESDCRDVLKEAIVAQANGSPGEHSNQVPKIGEKPDLDHPRVKDGERKAIKTNGSEGGELRSRYVFPILAALFILGCFLLVTLKLKKKR